MSASVEPQPVPKPTTRSGDSKQQFLIGILLVVAVAIAAVLVTRGGGGTPTTIKSGTVVIHHPSVTAAAKRGFAVFGAELQNLSNREVVLESVTTPQADRSMLSYDPAICNGNPHAMSILHSAVIPPFGSLMLNARVVGAMLMGLRSSLVAGQTVPIDVHVLDGGRERTIAFLTTVGQGSSSMPSNMSM